MKFKKDLITNIKKIIEDNEGYIYKLIFRKNKSETGYNIHIQKYEGNTKKSKSLGIFLNINEGMSTTNKEFLRLAISIRERSELNASLGKNGFEIENVEEEIDFFEYGMKVYEKRNKQVNYKICLNHYKEFSQKVKLQIKDITKKDCRDFVEFLIKKVPKKRTAHNYLICFKAILNQAQEDEIILVNPAKGLSIKYEEAVKEALTIDELKVLMNTPCGNRQIRNAFIFSCYTGLRKGDLIDLRWENVTDGSLELTVNKTKRILKFNLHPETQKILEEQKELIKESNTLSKSRGYQFDSERVFCIPSGGRGITILRKWFTDSNLFNQDRIKRLNFHSSRHTFVSILLNNGADPLIVQKLAGHQDFKTTQIYVHLMEERYKETIDKLPNLE